MDFDNSTGIPSRISFNFSLVEFIQVLGSSLIPQLFFALKHVDNFIIKHLISVLILTKQTEPNTEDMIFLHCAQSMQ
jgi:hypothetical protein